MTDQARIIFDGKKGQGIEAIGKALGVPTKELALPVKRLLADKRVRTQGQKRGTVYSAK